VGYKTQIININQFPSWNQKKEIMKKSITFLLFVSTFFMPVKVGVVGKWKTIDDQSGEEKSVVEIYENQIFGKVLEILM
jgi:putative effector of murein hydrolase LrgA (UPF0299 family)